MGIGVECLGSRFGDVGEVAHEGWPWQPQV